MKRFKKSLSAFVTLALLAAAVGTTVVNDTEKVLADESDVTVKLTTDVTEVKSGDTLTATLSIEKNPNLAGLTVRFNYDKEVLSFVSASVPDGSVYASAVVFPDIDMLDDKDADLNEVADGTVGFAYAEIKNKNVTGDILVATFKVIDDAKVGESKLTYEYLDASNASGNTLKIEGEETSFKVLCGHEKTTEKVTKEPTCTETGIKSTICDICGETVKTETIAALGHDFGEFKITKEPTCTEEGEKTAICSRCGETKTEAVAALGHDFGEFEITKEPTCTEEGKKTATCSRCGETKTESIPAVGHEYGEWTVTKEPTCTEEGEREAVCSVCGDKKTETIEPLGHHYDSFEVTKEESEEEDGELVRTCAVCGETITTVIPKIDAKNFGLKDSYGSEIKKEFYVGDTIEIKASIFSINDGEPVLGDVRYVPFAYMINESTGEWEKEPYSIKLTPDSEGEYKIIVEYVREINDTTGWVKTDKTYAFETVISALKKEEIKPENNNKTDDNNGSEKSDTINKTPAETVITDNKPSDNIETNNNDSANKNNSSAKNSSTPKTGDTAEAQVMLIGLMLVAGVSAVVASTKRRENKK